MRHEPLSYSGLNPGAYAGEYDTTYGRVRQQVVPPRPMPRMRPPPRLSDAELAQIANNISEAFENRGKEAGLEVAAAYRNRDIMDGAIAYLASRSKNETQLRQELANLRARQTQRRIAGRGRDGEFAFRRALIQARLARLKAGNEQAVADIPDIPRKEGQAPNFIPYLTLGIAIAGFLLAVGRKK